VGACPLVGSATVDPWSQAARGRHVLAQGGCHVAPLRQPWSRRAPWPRVGPCLGRRRRGGGACAAMSLAQSVPEVGWLLRAWEAGRDGGAPQRQLGAGRAPNPALVAPR